MKRAFPNEVLRELLWSDSVEHEGETLTEVSDEITDNSRWSIHHEFIFLAGDKFYRTHYSEGATEQQDERPWEYEAQVECTQVQPVSVLVTKYEEVSNEQSTGNP